MKRFNIVTNKKYTGRDGVEKSQWNTVGSLTYFPATPEKPEGYRLELNMFPTTPFYVFEQKPKAAPVAPPVRSADPMDVEITGPDSIPF